MLDEGINIQRLSLWVDLNRTTNAKNQLQRLGRILRLLTGKGWKRTQGREGVEWLSFQEPKDVEEKIKYYQKNENVDDAFKKLTNYWQNFVSKLQVNTPVKGRFTLILIPKV
jgi:superfamily II DNA or RNA helicase